MTLLIDSIWSLIEKGLDDLRKAGNTSTIYRDTPEAKSKLYAFFKISYKEIGSFPNQLIYAEA